MRRLHDWLPERVMLVLLLHGIVSDGLADGDDVHGEALIMEVIHNPAASNGATTAPSSSAALPSDGLVAIFEQATAHFHAGRYAEAYQGYLRCNDLRPVTGDVLNALALAAHMMKRYDLAEHWFEALLRLDPQYSDARLNLGSTCFEQGRHADALAHYDSVLAAQPDHAQAFYNRGVVLRLLKRLEESKSSYEQAIRLRPDYAEAYSNLGVVYHDMGLFAKALASYRQAQTLRPGYAEAWSNAGATYMALADYSASMQAYDMALGLNPGLPSACWNKGILLLLRGDLEQGLPLYEWRFHHQRQALFRRPLQLSTPRLRVDGNLSGQRVFLYDEQGLGDALQMVRYVPLLAERGAQVFLRVADELRGVLQGLAGVACLLGDADEVPPHDMQCPLMSLPLAMQTGRHSIPDQVPYLRVDAAKARAQREWLGRVASRGLRIGLVWAGNPRNPTDAKRSIPLQRLLSALPAQHDYVALQKHLSEDDAATLAGLGSPVAPQGAAGSQGLHVINAADRLGDFTDTAALCGELDLVVSVDTSVAHLAGALGVPVLLLLPCVPDWRWMLDRSDSPWYPSFALLRQPMPGDWTPVMQDLAARLNSLAA